MPKEKQRITRILSLILACSLTYGLGRTTKIKEYNTRLKEQDDRAEFYIDLYSETEEMLNNAWFRIYDLENEIDFLKDLYEKKYFPENTYVLKVKDTDGVNITKIVRPIRYRIAEGEETQKLYKPLFEGILTKEEIDGYHVYFEDVLSGEIVLSGVNLFAYTDEDTYVNYKSLTYDGHTDSKTTIIEDSNKKSEREEKNEEVSIELSSIIDYLTDEERLIISFDIEDIERILERIESSKEKKLSLTSK